jgi:transcription elongation factor Elf1
MKLPLENIQSLIRCPVCNKKYRSTQMLVIDEDDKRTTLHMSCEGCSASTIVFVSLGQFGVVTLGTLTDLEQSEARKVFQGEAVSTDNVIEAHQFLKHYTGGVEAFIQ